MPYKFTPDHTELREQNKFLEQIEFLSNEQINLLNQINSLNNEQMQFLIDIKNESAKASAIEKKRFVIQTSIFVVALIASVVAAAAAIISLI